MVVIRPDYNAEVTGSIPGPEKINISLSVIWSCLVYVHGMAPPIQGFPSDIIPCINAYGIICSEFFFCVLRIACVYLL